MGISTFKFKQLQCDFSKLKRLIHAYAFPSAKTVVGIFVRKVPNIIMYIILPVY